MVVVRYPDSLSAGVLGTASSRQSISKSASHICELVKYMCVGDVA